jgi:ketosteroid isomerase-like protein
MKRRTYLVTAIFLIVGAHLAFGQSNGIDSTNARVRAAIDSGNAKFMEANFKQDAKMLASLFCADGGFLLKNGAMVIGPANIEKEFGPWLQESGPFQMTITTQEVWLIDSTAYEYGLYTRKSLKPGADSTTRSGRYFESWKQQPDGSWKIFLDCGLPE